MRRRLIALAVVGAFAVAVGLATALADGVPSGERILGGPGFGSGNPVIQNGHPVGGTVIEPVYDNGAISYISTPARTPDPVKSNPIAAAPIYLPVYPAGGSYTGPLLCNHQNMVGSAQVDNCPDHGDAISFLATYYDPSVYGGNPSTVLGHDHVLDGPASHGDFNIAWVPVLVLFKSLSDVQHFTSNSAIEAAASGPHPTVTLINLDGSEPPFPGGPNGEMVSPDLTFHCSVVSQAVWNKAVPWPGTVGG
jgi:hypothetical protein